MAMQRAQLLSALLIGLSGVVALPAAANEVGHKGAEVYCFMRESGNPHNVSWDAAYARIKRQGSGLFKTSPKHAAVLITESVVTDRKTFGNCGKYLGALYSGAQIVGEEIDTDVNKSSDTRADSSSDRYSY